MTTFWDILGVTIHLLRFLADEGAIDYERTHWPRTGKRKSHPGHECRAAVLYRNDSSQPYIGEGITLHKYAILIPLAKLKLYFLNIGIGHESKTVVYSEV